MPRPELLCLAHCGDPHAFKQRILLHPCNLLSDRFFTVSDDYDDLLRFQPPDSAQDMLKQRESAEPMQDLWGLRFEARTLTGSEN
jgi:hypothetical protein